MFLVLSVVSLAQKPQQPAAQKARQVLVDFRNDHLTKPQRVPVATQRIVLSKVFRKYLTDENKCRNDFQPSGDNYLASARNAGQIVPLIGDVVPGSFTAPGQSETAYVIWVSECGATHADNYGSKRVAIFSGQKLVADVDADFNGNVIRKTDLDMDGVDELLMSGGDMAQGTVIEVAELVEFRNGRRRVIQDLGTVVEDNCGSGFPGASSKASVLSISNVELGKMPKLRIDNYVASCKNTKRWRFLSTGKMQ